MSLVWIQLLFFIAIFICFQSELMSDRVETLNPIYSHAQALDMRAKLITDPLACLAKQFNPMQNIQCALTTHQLCTAEQQAEFYGSSECLQYFEPLPEDPMLLLSGLRGHFLKQLKSGVIFLIILSLLSCIIGAMRNL